MEGLSERQWTVMVYMAGDRYLDNNGFADLKELRAGRPGCSSEEK
ncbi:MAG: hypothetical protein ACR2HX_17980 [Pyrinomonadaceae bacterium]